MPDNMGRRIAIALGILVFGLGQLIGWMERDTDPSIVSVIIIVFLCLVASFAVLFIGWSDHKDPRP